MPAVPPADRLSTKKHKTPSSTTAQAHKSSRRGLLFQKRAESRMTKTGAVNCSTMALAAVVILFAKVKKVLVPQMHSAPTKTHRLSRGLCLTASKYPPMTTRATMFRPLLMDKPLHGMTLMHNPPMLYRTAAKNTKSTPCTFLVSVACCVKNTPCPIGTEGDERGTTSVRRYLAKTASASQ